MQNPLLTLDEIVYKQFEKITIKANKTLGWSKYDLGRVTDTAANLTFSIYGVYMGIAGSINNSPGEIIFGGGLVVVGYIFNKDDNKLSDIREKYETEYVERNEAPMQPLYHPVRPILLVLSLATIVTGILTHIGIYTIDPEKYKNISGLIQESAGGFMMFGMCSSYFRSQIMAPPKKKKKLWKAVYDGVKNKFKAKTPAPVEVPASHYISLE